MQIAVVSTSQARKSISHLIDQTTESHAPITITGKRNSAVLISSADWAAVQETLFLLSMPGLNTTLRSDMAASSSEFSKSLNW